MSSGQWARSQISWRARSVQDTRLYYTLLSILRQAFSSFQSHAVPANVLSPLLWLPCTNTGERGTAVLVHFIRSVDYAQHFSSERMSKSARGSLTNVPKDWLPRQLTTPALPKRCQSFSLKILPGVERGTWTWKRVRRDYSNSNIRHAVER